MMSHMSAETRPVQVVVAYDFSPSAEEAMIRATDVAARAPQHVLHFLVAIDAGSDFGLASGKPDYQTAERVQEQVTERVTAAFAGRTTEHEVQFFVHARLGKPGDEILALASEVGADLIFIGSHGKTGIQRLLLGSVSERIVREAQCPVMIARAKTYPDVDLMKIVKSEHELIRRTSRRFSYVNHQILTRPDDWPLN